MNICTNVASTIRHNDVLPAINKYPRKRESMLSYQETEVVITLNCQSISEWEFKKISIRIWLYEMLSIFPTTKKTEIFQIYRAPILWQDNYVGLYTMAVNSTYSRSQLRSCLLEQPLYKTGMTKLQITTEPESDQALWKGKKQENLHLYLGDW